MGVFFLILGAFVVAALSSSPQAPQKPLAQNGPILSPDRTQWLPLEPEFLSTSVGGIPILDYYQRDLVGPGERIFVLYAPESRATYVLLSGVVHTRTIRRPLDNLLQVVFDRIEKTSSENVPSFAGLPTLPIAAAITANNVFNTDPPRATTA